MSSSFAFHHPLHLKKITEDLPYRLCGIKREIKILNDSDSSSEDSIDKEFRINNNYLNDPKRIRKEYTIKPKKKKPTVLKTSRKGKDTIPNDKTRETNEFDATRPKELSTVTGRRLVASSCSHHNPPAFNAHGSDKPLPIPTIPMTWHSAKKNFVVKKKENTILDYLENRAIRSWMTQDELNHCQNTLRKIEESRKNALENQTIPDWAKGARGMIITAPKKTKVNVRSKYMQTNDYLT